VDADVIERFALTDTAQLEVRIRHESAQERPVTTVEVLLEMNGRARTALLLAKDASHHEAGTTALCGRGENGVLADFHQILVDLPGDLPEIPEHTPPTRKGRKALEEHKAEYRAALDAWKATVLAAPHRAAVDRVDDDTVRVSVDAERDGTPDRVWTVDLGWMLKDSEFRHECEADLSLQP
jgi:hypothetical protein